MKFTIASSLALAMVPVAAFPSKLMTEDISKQMDAIAKRQSSPPQGAGALPASPPPFNATQQYVSTTGQYAFVPPGAGDIRGECPGLNAMANHNYLPHNGVATIQQFIQATGQVFGMAPDLAGFLAFYGAWVDGDGTSWNLLGQPHTGIGGSHGNYETDSSPLKSDLNQYGYNSRLIMSQFYELYNMQPNATTANYNLEVLRNFRGIRFAESVSKNPYFTYNPFAGIEVSQAAFTFIYRFMSNKSAAYPEGILNKAVLKSFMSISGPENNLTWTPGYEQIPNNWYKRNSADLYSIPYFQTDILYFAQQQPEILVPGCNMGKVNSYNAFNPSTLTNGAYTFQSVAQNPLCFTTAYIAYQNSQNAFGLPSNGVSALASVISQAQSAIGASCPAITSYNSSVMAACPGASLYGGPTGPVAPGAIQS